jgi:hypothetical protein
VHPGLAPRKDLREPQCALQIPPLRYATVGMTRGMGWLRLEWLQDGKKPHSQSSLAGLFLVVILPRTNVLGYSQPSLRDSIRKWSSHAGAKSPYPSTARAFRSLSHTNSVAAATRIVISELLRPGASGSRVFPEEPKRTIRFRHSSTGTAGRRVRR